MIETPVTSCDLCEKEDYQENMINCYYELNVLTQDIKDDMVEFDGMVCESCFEKELKKQGELK